MTLFTEFLRCLIAYFSFTQCVSFFYLQLSFIQPYNIHTNPGLLVLSLTSITLFSVIVMITIITNCVFMAKNDSESEYVKVLE